MTAASPSTSAQAPPVAHAIGGSLGSAMALLMFYPLERARIDLQSGTSLPTNNHAFDFVEVDIDGVPTNDQGTISPSPRIPCTPRSPLNEDESWVSLTQDEEKNESSKEKAEVVFNTDNISSSTPTIAASDPEWTKVGATKKREESLFECLVRLHQRKELYNGVYPVVSTIFTSQFIFFYIHAAVKKIFNQSSRGDSKRSNAAALSLVASCVAGIGNVLLTNPLWVVNMAIVTGETNTLDLWRELYVMMQTKGFAHMWKGTSASILLVSNPVIQFFCYEQMKAARLRSPTNSILPPMEAFFIGATAKGIATVATYPLQLAQTVLRLRDTKDKGTLDCLRKLYAEGGLAKLFTGLRAKLLQTVLTAAFTFLTYEQILGVVQGTLTSAVGMK